MHTPMRAHTYAHAETYMLALVLIGCVSTMVSSSSLACVAVVTAPMSSSRRDYVSFDSGIFFLWNFLNSSLM